MARTKIQTLPLGRCPKTVPTYYGIAKHGKYFVVLRVWRDGDTRVNQAPNCEYALRFRNHRDAVGQMDALNDALGVNEFSYLSNVEG